MLLRQGGGLWGRWGFVSWSVPVPPLCQGLDLLLGLCSPIWGGAVDVAAMVLPCWEKRGQVVFGGPSPPQNWGAASCHWIAAWVGVG